jgi:hypothetical protein|tara:strand:- start:358 stop:1164 length:807 start_codon:yes stop_codon:yes gene_type:complete
MKYKVNNIEINLSNQLKDFDYFTKNPFIVFEKKNFIDELSYQKLVKEIYAYKNFQRTFSGSGDKKSSTIHGSNLFIINDGIFKDFCSAILHKNFFRWFKNTHLPFFKTKFLKIYIVKRKNIFFRIFNRLSKILRLPISLFYTEIEYSSITNGGYIPPHTDIYTKRLSFVFYLPDIKKDFTSEMKKQLGTTFWKAQKTAVLPIKRFASTFLEDQEKKDFYNDYEPFHTSIYEPNKIVGFIKSDISWHTVKKINFELDRRVIVINVYEWL